MGLTGFLATHLFGVAMIGGYQRLSTRRLQCCQDPSQTLVDDFDGFDRSFKITGMADHIRVGVVADNHLIFATLDRLDQMVGYLGALISGCRS